MSRRVAPLRPLSGLLAALLVVASVLAAPGHPTEAAPNPFADVSPGDPAYEAITELAALDIIRGFDCPDDPLRRCFGPGQGSLRAQMAALLARATGLPAATGANPFADRCHPTEGCVDDELWGHVNALAAAQVTRGTSPTTFSPHNFVLKQQVILFISRAKVAKGEWTLQPERAGLYPGSAADEKDRRDIATYVHYAGTPPDAPAALGQPWGDFAAGATRGWFARALWQVYRPGAAVTAGGASPSPGPSPSPDASSSPGPSPAPSPIPSPSASPSPGVSPSSGPSPSPSPSSSPRPTPTPQPSPSPSPRPSVSPSPTPRPTSSPSSSPSPPPSLPPNSTTTDAAFVAQVLALTNQERQANGCTVNLTANGQLQGAAQGYAEYMATEDWFAHNARTRTPAEHPLDNSTPGTRIAQWGYRSTVLAENIAAGYATPEAVVAGWMNSAGHRNNILNCGLRELGVGYAFLANDTGTKNYNHYWVQKLGNPAAP